MKRTQYTAEFKTKVVKQILEKRHPATEVSSRLGGVSVGLLYTWTRKVRGLNEEPLPDDLKALRAEMAKLKAELRRTTEERDILKKAAAYFAKVSE
jgi:transposase